MTHDEHLTDGTLRALDDGELSPLAALRARLHLHRCALCRAGRADLRALHAQAHGVLTSLERVQGVDVEDGWRRLAAVRGAAGARHGWRRTGSPVAALAAAAAIVALALVMHRTGRAPEAETMGARRDVCCWDLDGGGHIDDGVMTVSRAGQQVACVVLYDDVDRSRSLTPGDVIRYVSNPVACGMPGGRYPRTADRTTVTTLALLP